MTITEDELFWQTFGDPITEDELAERANRRAVWEAEYAERIERERVFWQTFEDPAVEAIAQLEAAARLLLPDEPTSKQISIEALCMHLNAAYGAICKVRDQARLQLRLIAADHAIGPSEEAASP